MVNTAPLCAAVCCGVPLPCAVPSVPRCSPALWCRSVAPCCLFCFLGGVGLCPFRVLAVLCCAVWFVLFCAALVCAVAGALRCGAPLCVMLSPSAFCGVVVLPCCAARCAVVSCCAVLCSVVPCCRVVPCCLAVLCVPLCWGWSFRLSPLSGVLMLCPAAFCALCCVLRCCAALWRCAGWLRCAAVWPAGCCFFVSSSFASLPTPAFFPVL